jgi:hypothetical protein
MVQPYKQQVTKCAVRMEFFSTNRRQRRACNTLSPDDARLVHDDLRGACAAVHAAKHRHGGCAAVVPGECGSAAGGCRGAGSRGAAVDFAPVQKSEERKRERETEREVGREGWGEKESEGEGKGERLPGRAGEGDVSTAVVGHAAELPRGQARASIRLCLCRHYTKG